MRGPGLIGEAHMCFLFPTLHKTSFSCSVSGSHEDYRNCDLQVAFLSSFLLVKYKMAYGWVPYHGGG